MTLLAGDLLRAATRDVHARLHDDPAFAPVLADPPDMPGYIRLLLRLQQFHVPAEARLFEAAARLLPGLDDLAGRRKAHLLGLDLATLGSAVFGGAAFGGAAPVPSPIATLPALLGGLYVVEGATLGGRDLARRLAPSLGRLGLSGAEGRRFFMAYEPRQGAMWRRFCAELEAAAAGFTAAERQAMQNAARETFLSLERGLAADAVAA